MDCSALDKLLYDEKDTLDYFLLVLKVDYSYFDDQMLFVMGLLAILAVYIIWNKIVQAVLAVYTERQVRYRMEG